MRARYGANVDAEIVNLSFSDPQAFNLWGVSDLTKEGVIVDPEDRIIQRSFWIRYIGHSESRLAQAFNGFFMPEGLYSRQPSPFIETKFQYQTSETSMTMPKEGSSLRRLSAKRCVD